MNNCPNKYRKLIRNRDCDSCIKGQRVKFFYYRKNQRPIKVRARIIGVLGKTLMVSHVKIGRGWLGGRRGIRLPLSHMKFFEHVKLCEEGQRMYPYLCQNGIEKRLEGRAVAETTSNMRPKLSAHKVPFWHKLKSILTR
jgi:hypothetical protein